MAAVRAPAAPGAKLTMKVVVPLGPATGAVGLLVMVKSAALVPSLVIVKPVRSALPMFLIVKVRGALEPTVTEPKSLDPASEMSVPTGCSTAISGAGVTTVGVQTTFIPVKLVPWSGKFVVLALGPLVQVMVVPVAVVTGLPNPSSAY